MNTKFTHSKKFTPASIIKSHLAMGMLCIGLASCSQIPAFGKTTLSSDLRMNGKQVEAAFEEQRLVLQQCSAVIYRNRKPIAHGIVMSADGYILVKNSELFELNEEKKDILKNDLTIIIDEERHQGMTLIASDTKWDLAVIKIDAKNLTPMQWAEQAEIDQGTWVIANGSSTMKRRRANIGIISANAREIKGNPPVMIGLALVNDKDTNGIKINKVADNSGAKDAGVLKGDIIKSFDGQEVTTREQIIDIIRKKQPGDFVELKLLRKENIETLSMELRPRSEIADDKSETKSKNDFLSGRFSARRDSFPIALQHDIDQAPRQTGGPLLNLEGKAIGINIARANRAESFAIPAKEAQEVYKELMKTAK